MKLRHILPVAALFVAASAPAQQINPITKAVLRGYEQTLKENPKDFETLYQRSAQYYNLSMYDNALTDISRAIEYTPAKESSMLQMEYSLLADICIELKEYGKALDAVNKVLEMSPDSYADLYKKGNIQLHLKDAEGAYRSFSSMQRLKSRSQEAYFGMASACVLMDRKAEAEELLNEARNADPSSAITYCRLGDLYRQMGDNHQAAANYLSAFALADNTDRPLQSLINLGETDFTSVSEAIDYALSRSDNQVPLLFLKGNISNLTGNFNEAYASLTDLLKVPEARQPSVYAALAESCLALNKIDEARGNADRSLELNQNADNMLLKARISRAEGKPAEAVAVLDRLLAKDGSNVDALVCSALANVDLGNNQKALQQLNEAVISNASDPLPLMVRAWLNATVLNNQKSAVADRNRVASMPVEGFPGVAYKALAKALNGKKMDGDAIVEEALAASPTKTDLYHAAVYYAQSGNLEKAVEMRDKARSLGFSNIYLLESDRTANLNLLPIAHLK